MAKRMTEDQKIIEAMRESQSITFDQMEALRLQLRQARRMLTVLLRDITETLDNLEDEEMGI
jgi:hypothetical protein